MPNQIEAIYDAVGDAHCTLQKQIGPALLQLACLLFISREHDKLDVTTLTQQLHCCIEEFVTLRIVIVRLTRGGPNGGHNLLFP